MFPRSGHVPESCWQLTVHKQAESTARVAEAPLPWRSPRAAQDEEQCVFSNVGAPKVSEKLRKDSNSQLYDVQRCSEISSGWKV